MSEPNATTEQPKVETPKATAPVTPPATVMPATPAASPTPDRSAARIAELEARLKTTDEVLGKLRGVFGGEPAVDPAVQAAELKARADKLQQFAGQAIVAAATAQVAARDTENENALEDLVNRVVSSGTVEVNWTTGRVRDPAAVVAAVNAERTSRSYLFRKVDATPTAFHPVPLTGRPAPAPTPAATPPPVPAPALSFLDMLRAPLSQLNSITASQGKRPM